MSIKRLPYLVKSQISSLLWQFWDSSQVALSPTYESGHTQDLIFCAGFDLNSVAVCDQVSWSYHFLVRVSFRAILCPCRVEEHIYAHSRRIMDSDYFQNAL